MRLYDGLEWIFLCYYFLYCFEIFELLIFVICDMICGCNNDFDVFFVVVGCWEGFVFSWGDCVGWIGNFFYLFVMLFFDIFIGGGGERGVGGIFF